MHSDFSLKNVRMRCDWPITPICRTLPNSPSLLSYELTNKSECRGQSSSYLLAFFASIPILSYSLKKNPTCFLQNARPARDTSSSSTLQSGGFPHHPPGSNCLFSFLLMLSWSDGCQLICRKMIFRDETYVKVWLSSSTPIPKFFKGSDFS